MAYCTKCGQKLDENANFCTSCGEKVSNSTHSFNDTLSELGHTHDSSSSFDKKSTRESPSYLSSIRLALPKSKLRIPI